jgi:VIT1/CCC1 family predicted Fe2+/Mn2+ transporter
MSRIHLERHVIARIGWLRASVLGANDGVVSTASLVVGVAAAGADRDAILVAGVAGLVAGAMSMAAGEYVSVSSQSDAEKADLARERAELKTDIEFERQELADIYVARGLTPELAREVALQLMAKDALGAHARDELGISEITAARPLQAALASGLAFSSGAILPIVVAFVAPVPTLSLSVSVAALIFLALLGGLGARVGRSAPVASVVRVVFWGAAALALTAGIGALFGTGA